MVPGRIYSKMSWDYSFIFIYPHESHSPTTTQYIYFNTLDHLCSTILLNYTSYSQNFNRIDWLFFKLLFFSSEQPEKI